MDSKVICIGGMHRSGTSLLTSWIQECGLPISDGAMVPSGIGNVKGHFEDSEFVKFHQDLINSALPNSKGWIVGTYRDWNSLRFNRSLAEEILLKRNQKYSMWGWKDPRTVLFLDEWKSVISRLLVLYFWRPCNEVVTSLIRRGKNRPNDRIVHISAFKAIQMWVLYQRLAVSYFQSHRSETLVFSLKGALVYDTNVINTINSTFNTTLSQNSISSVYNQQLLIRKDEAVIRTLCQFFPAVRRLEKELNSLSRF